MPSALRTKRRAPSTASPKTRKKPELRESGKKAGLLEKLSLLATQAAGGSLAFALATGVIVVWAATGPLFGYSNTWQLVINTGTTIVTFLMVFLIQRSQNKDSRATQLKLNEIVAALKGASNRLIDAEDFSEAEIEILRRHYRELVDLAKKDNSLTETHSVEEARRSSAAKRNS